MKNDRRLPHAGQLTKYHITLRYGREQGEDIVVATVKNLARPNTASKTFQGRTPKTILAKIGEWIAVN
jgi:hypothetical protein